MRSKKARNIWMWKSGMNGINNGGGSDLIEDQKVFYSGIYREAIKAGPKLRVGQSSGQGGRKES